MGKVISQNVSSPPPRQPSYMFVVNAMNLNDNIHPIPCGNIIYLYYLSLFDSVLCFRSTVRDIEHISLWKFEIYFTLKSKISFRCMHNIVSNYVNFLINEVGFSSSSNLYSKPFRLMRFLLMLSCIRTSVGCSILLDLCSSVVTQKTQTKCSIRFRFHSSTTKIQKPHRTRVVAIKL